MLSLNLLAAHLVQLQLQQVLGVVSAACPSLTSSNSPQTRSRTTKNLNFPSSVEVAETVRAPSSTSSSNSPQARDTTTTQNSTSFVLAGGEASGSAFSSTSPAIGASTSSAAESLELHRPPTSIAAQPDWRDSDSREQPPGARLMIRRNPGAAGAKEEELRAPHATTPRPGPPTPKSKIPQKKEAILIPTSAKIVIETPAARPRAHEHAEEPQVETDHEHPCCSSEDVVEMNNRAAAAVLPDKTKIQSQSPGGISEDASSSAPLSCSCSSESLRKTKMGRQISPASISSTVVKISSSSSGLGENCLSSSSQEEEGGAKRSKKTSRHRSTGEAPGPRRSALREQDDSSADRGRVSRTAPGETLMRCGVGGVEGAGPGTSAAPALSSSRGGADRAPSACEAGSRRARTGLQVQRCKTEKEPTEVPEPDPDEAVDSTTTSSEAGATRIVIPSHSTTGCGSRTTPRCGAAGIEGETTVVTETNPRNLSAASLSASSSSSSSLSSTVSENTRRQISKAAAHLGTNFNYVRDEDGCIIGRSGTQKPKPKRIRVNGLRQSVMAARASGTDTEQRQEELEEDFRELSSSGSGCHSYAQRRGPERDREQLAQQLRRNEDNAGERRTEMLELALGVSQTPWEQEVPHELPRPRKVVEHDQKTEESTELDCFWQDYPLCERQISGCSSSGPGAGQWSQKASCSSSCSTSASASAAGGGAATPRSMMSTASGSVAAPPLAPRSDSISCSAAAASASATPAAISPPSAASGSCRRSAASPAAQGPSTVPAVNQLVSARAAFLDSYLQEAGGAEGTGRGRCRPSPVPDDDGPPGGARSALARALEDEPPPARGTARSGTPKRMNCMLELPLFSPPARGRPERVVYDCVPVSSSKKTPQSSSSQERDAGASTSGAGKDEPRTPTWALSPTDDHVTSTSCRPPVPPPGEYTVIFPQPDARLDVRSRTRRFESSKTTVRGPGVGGNRPRESCEQLYEGGTYGDAAQHNRSDVGPVLAKANQSAPEVSPTAHSDPSDGGPTPALMTYFPGIEAMPPEPPMAHCKWHQARSPRALAAGSEDAPLTPGGPRSARSPSTGPSTGGRASRASSCGSCSSAAAHTQHGTPNANRAHQQMPMSPRPSLVGEDASASTLTGGNASCSTSGGQLQHDVARDRLFREENESRLASGSWLQRPVRSRTPSRPPSEAATPRSGGASSHDSSASALPPLPRRPSGQIGRRFARRFAKEHILVVDPGASPEPPPSPTIFRDGRAPCTLPAMTAMRMVEGAASSSTSMRSYGAGGYETDADGADEESMRGTNASTLSLQLGNEREDSEPGRESLFDEDLFPSFENQNEDERRSLASQEGENEDNEMKVD